MNKLDFAYRSLGICEEVCREKQAEIDALKTDLDRSRQQNLIDLAERDALKAQRDVAIKHIAEWCVAIQQNGAGWDDWDEYYKKACCRDNALPEIRSALNAAIAKARGESV